MAKINLKVVIKDLGNREIKINIETTVLYKSCLDRILNNPGITLKKYDDKTEEKLVYHLYNAKNNQIVDDFSNEQIGLEENDKLILSSESLSERVEAVEIEPLFFRETEQPKPLQVEPPVFQSYESIKTINKNDEEETCWLDAQQSDVAAGYQIYLNRFPYGANTKWAQDKIKLFDLENRLLKHEREHNEQLDSEKLQLENWRKAENENTIESYHSFILNFSSSKYSEFAKRNLDILESQNQINQFEYQKKQLFTEFENEKADLKLEIERFKADEKNWTEVKDSILIETIESFIEYNPESVFLNHAMDRITLLKKNKEIDSLQKGLDEEQKLRKNIEVEFEKLNNDSNFKKNEEGFKTQVEDNAWIAAAQEKTIHAYQTFINEYPISKHTKDAVLEIQKIMLLDAIKLDENKITNINEKIQNLEIDKDFWQQQSIQNSLNAYQTYLVKYPHGVFAGLAELYVAKLELQNEILVNKNKIESLGFGQSNFQTKTFETLAPPKPVASNEKTWVEQTNKPAKTLDQKEKIQWWNGVSNSWKKALLKSIGHAGKPSMDQIEKILNLTKLDVSSNSEITDLEPLAVLFNLKDLSCQSTSIESLDSISENKNLERLNFSRTKVSSLNPISKLNKLQVLDCSFTNIKSVKPLASITTIEELYCINTKILFNEFFEFQNLHPNCIIQNS